MSTRATIRRVSYSEILLAPNAHDLISEYAAECSIPHIGKINPQAETYAALEAAGLGTFFGVFDGEHLVGFAEMVFLVHPDYGVRVAVVEKLFVTMVHRFGGTGRALMDALEIHATEERCVTIVYRAREDSQFNWVLAASKPYHLTSLVYCRSLA